MVKYPYPIFENNEDDLLSQIIFKEVFPTLPTEQKIILGLRLQGFTQSAISRLMNISRTSIGAMEKQAINTIASNMR